MMVQGMDPSLVLHGAQVELLPVRVYAMLARALLELAVLEGSLAIVLDRGMLHPRIIHFIRRSLVAAD